MNSQPNQDNQEDRIPLPSEHVIFKPAAFMLVADSETGEERYVWDYSAGFQTVVGFLQWGNDF